MTPDTPPVPPPPTAGSSATCNLLFAPCKVGCDVQHVDENMNFWQPGIDDNYNGSQNLFLLDHVSFNFGLSLQTSRPTWGTLQFLTYPCQQKQANHNPIDIYPVTTIAKVHE